MAMMEQIHNLLILHVACDTVPHAPTLNLSVDASSPDSISGARNFTSRKQYDVQKAETYQSALAFWLQQHFIPFVQRELDLLATKFATCLVAAATSTICMPQVCRRSRLHSSRHQA